MPGRAAFHFLDRNGDRNSFSIPGLVVTAANHDVELGKVTALLNAIDAVSNVGIVQYDMVGRTVNTGTPQPTAGEAQNEKHWLVRYNYDSDPSIKRSFKIYGADLSVAGILEPASEDMDLASTEGAALVAAIEDYVREDTGIGAITVESITFHT